MAIKDEVWAAFWVRWGPIILMFHKIIMHLFRAVVLVVLELLGDVGVIAHGLEWLLNRLLRALDWLLNIFLRALEWLLALIE